MSIIQSTHRVVYVSWGRDADTITVVTRESGITVHAACLCPLTRTLYLTQGISFPMLMTTYPLYLMSCESKIAQPEMGSSRNIVTGTLWSNIVSLSGLSLTPEAVYFSAASRMALFQNRESMLCSPTLSCTLHLSSLLTPRCYNVQRLHGPNGTLLFMYSGPSLSCFRPTQNYEPSILKTRMVYQAMRYTVARSHRGLLGFVLLYLGKE